MITESEWTQNRSSLLALEQTQHSNNSSKFWTTITETLATELEQILIPWNHAWIVTAHINKITIKAHINLK